MREKKKSRARLSSGVSLESKSCRVMGTKVALADRPEGIAPGSAGRLGLVA